MINRELKCKTRTAALIAVFAAVALTIFLPVSLPAIRAATQSQVYESVAKAFEYLKQCQQEDGGFGEPGTSSSEKLTAWAVCSIAAGGGDPGKWTKGGSSPIDYLSKSANKAAKLTDFSSLCIAVSAAGKDPRDFGGLDLVGRIKSNLKPNGQIGSMINEHMWALIALAAAGERIPDASLEWLAARQNIDGGFGYSEQSGSDPDDTGAAIQALVASGMERENPVIKRALVYLKFCQAEDGGFSWQTEASNVASTAWALQGIWATGEDPNSESWKSSSGNTPIDYLLSMQKEDGHFRHSRNLDSYPCWMTVQVIPALLRKPFPITSKKEQGGTPPPYSTGSATGTLNDDESTAGEQESENDDIKNEDSIAKGSSNRLEGDSPEENHSVETLSLNNRQKILKSTDKTESGFGFFITACLGYGALLLLAYMIISAIYAS